MSHPDPLFDPDNSYEDDNMNYADDVDASNYDDYNDFYEGEEDSWEEEYDDSMDGDWDSGMTSAGWGTDEDYGHFGDYNEDY
jgi:hypothetical protein